MSKWSLEQWKKIAKVLFFPNNILTFFMVNISIIVLVYALVFNNTESIVAYIGYAFSAYTLTVVVLKMPPLIKKVKNGLYANKYSSTILTEAELRLRIGLYAGCAINIVYAALKFMAGVHFRSFWIGAVAVYYVVLGMTRFGLIKREYYGKKHSDAKEQRIHDLKIYRRCGCLMFLLNQTVMGLVIQMVQQNKSFTYPGLLIYAFAAYTFYCFSMAIVNMVKYRKLERPILSAAKMISFACALTSVLTLQTALLAEFGENQATFIKMMNSLTGFAVCTAVFILAIYMIRRANKEIKRMEDESGNE